MSNAVRRRRAYFRGTIKGRRSTIAIGPLVRELRQARAAGDRRATRVLAWAAFDRHNLEHEKLPIA